MKKILISLILGFSLTTCYSLPVNEEDIDTIEEKLDQCIGNLEVAQDYLETLINELHQCIETCTSP